MLTLILTIIFSIGFAFLATQNSNPVTLKLAGYTFAGVPLYVVALGSLFLGILLAAIISGLNSVANFMALRNKENNLKSAQYEIDKLHDRLRDYEIENAKLKGTAAIAHDIRPERNDHRPQVEINEDHREDNQRVSLKDRLRHTFS